MVLVLNQIVFRQSMLPIRYLRRISRKFVKRGTFQSSNRNIILNNIIILLNKIISLRSFPQTLQNVWESIGAYYF